MDYLLKMKNANSEEEKVEIYLFAEAALQEDELLQVIVKESKSQEVLNCYAEKKIQEQELRSSGDGPKYFKRAIKEKHRHKEKGHNYEEDKNTTNENW